MLTATTLSQEIDAFFAGRADLLDDPYPLYHRLRAACPVYAHGPQRVLTRYADIAAVLRDPRFSSNGNKGSRRRAVLASLPEPAHTQMREMMDFTGQWMLFSDPPHHTRLRAVANKAFTARRVEELRQGMQRLVDDLLEPVAGAGRLDVIADLAHPLPVIVIAEMLGVPAEDRGLIRRWSNEIAVFFGSGFRNVTAAHQSVAAFRLYLRDIIAHRRAAPRDDLLSALISARDEDGRLSDEELLGLCVLLLFAGHETTTNLIGNGLLALLRHPTQLARLRANPTLIVPAVEELLRYDSPVQGMARVATVGVALGASTVRPGETLLLLYGAANRDPARFARPDSLDITRRENKHLAFAYGPHFCLGAALARMEGQIALGRLLRRLSNIQLANERVEWRANPLMRGLKALPMTFTPTR